ncbi:AAA family ATPase [Roseobacter sp. YSTF-M11]|uniref:AAA family ATPase n=1 Tax=Roseobacter insulae TaxID=2859783 RepID=A0A9X1FV33_9RHOB|nr:AAA family ATPase [Roseobacter insulae]MBW4708515.1 AAA family ATPase [Roseobacter insulae]
MNGRVLISGCSGGGKSTLLDEIEARGHAVVKEPGRRIVAEQKAGDGKALPWVDMAAFARRATEMARHDLSAAAERGGFVFFDRGLVDAAVALQQAIGVPVAETLAGAHRYAPCVFLAPPWPEIFTRDADRQHDLSTAIAEYHRLEQAFDALGYAICLLPKAPVSDRADLVLQKVGLT